MLRRWLGSGSGRITRREADLLLDGSSDAPHAGLSDLLAAAAASGRPDELAGERAAVAGFRREFRPAGSVGPARDPAAARGARPRRRRVGIVAALSAAVLAVGGTAYAGSTGLLPGPVQRAVDGVFDRGGPASPSTDPTRVGGPADATPGRTAQPPGSAPGPTGPGGPPAPDAARLTGLCRSWEAVQGNPHANAISDEDLRMLIEAAGGEDRIGAFCAALRSRTADPPEPGRPGNPDPGGGRPTVPPGGGPTKKGESR